MNAKIDRKDCKAVARVVKRNAYIQVLWMKEKEDKIQSTVGCQLVYANKSQTSLSASPFSFYSVYVTFLNYTGEACWKQIAL